MKTAAFAALTATLTLAGTTLFAADVPATRPSAVVKAAVTIDPAAKPTTYSRLLFGGFLEHFARQVYGGVFDPGNPLSDKNGIRQDVVQALRDLRTPVVRWPGGCFVSGYHWESGVGPDRKPTDDMAWGVKEPNTFGTDEYVELCRQVGWEPYICNNAGNGTIEEMKDWLAYCNAKEGKYAQMRAANGHAGPLSVPIWSVGNENYHPTEIGHKPAETWAPFVADAAKQMKAIDPSIKLTAAAMDNPEWTLPLLKAAGPYLDYISIHTYWFAFFGKNEMPSYMTCIMKSEGPERVIESVQKILDESGYRGKIKIAYDEWNLRSWHHPGFPRTTVQDYDDPQVKKLIAAREKAELPQQYTMADALFTASFYNACLRNADDVGMANIAPIVNTRGPLYVYPKGIVKRTHFHAMSMYANELQPQVGKATVTADPLKQGKDEIPVVDAIATVSDNGDRWAVALVNRSPKATAACTVKVGSAALDGDLEAVVLSGDSPEAFNSVDRPDRVVPVTKTLHFASGVAELPPHSLTIVKFSRPSAPKN